MLILHVKTNSLQLEENGRLVTQNNTAVGSSNNVVHDFEHLEAELRILWKDYLAHRYPGRWRRLFVRTPACLHILLDHVQPPTPLEQQALIQATHAATMARQIQIYRQGELLHDWKISLRNIL